MENTFQIVERGLTFFECVARSIDVNKTHATALEIHNRLVLHLAQIVFVEADMCATIEEFLANYHSMTLRTSGVLHSAVKQWARRIHAKEKSVAKDPAIWLKQYPKFYKAVMLRFIHYHRDYRTKPHRLYCRRVFAHLVADLYVCRVGLLDPNTDQFNWIYPVDSGDYLSDVQLPAIVIQQDSEIKEQFALIMEPTSIINVTNLVPCLLTCTTMYFDATETDTPIYNLRRYTKQEDEHGMQKHINTVVGTFKKQGPNVHAIEYRPKMDNDDGSVYYYMIYPSDESKTMFVFLKDQAMYIFHVQGDEKESKATAICCCENVHHDTYPYFELKPLVFAILVVMAKNQQEAKKYVTEQTKFKVLL